MLLLIVFAYCFGVQILLAMEDVPTSDNFLRRALHYSILMGNRIYIDGGQSSQLVGGTPYKGIKENVNRMNNVTLSLDLSSDWTNSSLVFTSFSKSPAPNLNMQIMWSNSNGTSAYTWGGTIEFGPDSSVPPLKLWRLSVDGQGGGSWTDVAFSFNKFFQLFRPAYGCGTTIEGVGYYIGGGISPGTDKSTTKEISKPGIIKFNTSSGEWDTRSSVGLGDRGTISGAQIVKVPAPGLRNLELLIFLGGFDPGTAVYSASSFYSFRNITVYDPHNDRWFFQEATGNAPSSRASFCAVAVAGDTGTHEIFIYGGRSAKEAYGDAYVLSIPSFNWVKVDDQVEPRAYHTCETIRGQMITIGGLNIDGGGGALSQEVWSLADSFKQGVGIFDMTELVWKNSYKANSSNYTTPEQIKSWYSSGNLAKMRWQNNELRTRFVPDMLGNSSFYPNETTDGIQRTSDLVANITSNGTATTTKVDNKETANDIQNGKSEMTKGERIGMICSLSVGIPSALYALVELYRHWTTRKNLHQTGNQAIPFQLVRHRMSAVRSRWSL